MPTETPEKRPAPALNERGTSDRLPSESDAAKYPESSRLKERLRAAVDEHDPTLDAVLFNGGTILTLSFTAAAAIFSAGGKAELGAALSAIAGVLVAAERALAFGARWRFHREMRNGYQSVIDMIEFNELLPDGPEKEKYQKDTWSALYSLRTREAGIPGTGSAPT